MEQISSVDEMKALSEKNDMLLVYFAGNICKVCQDMIAKLETVIKNYPLIKAVKVEMSKSPELSASCGIFTAPAVILFIQEKETIREAGIISLINLEEKIARYYGLFYDEKEIKYV